MHISRVAMKVIGAALFLCALVPVLAWAADGVDPAQAQAQRQVTQPLNNAPFWREVRKGQDNPYQTTQVRGNETNVLVQSEGELWRQVRNGPLTIYGGWLIVGVFALLALFYWWRGKMRLHEPLTGRRIVRFSPWDRLVHWTSAISFVILALSGIVMLFGKYILLPIIGYTLFSWLAILGKNLHNFVGPIFVVSTIAMFVTYVRDNIPDRSDWIWIKRFGDFVKGVRIPAGKYNAFQKAWFWFGATLLALVLGASGLVLDFPNFDQTRFAMQIANIVHATAAVLMIAAALGHIYMGTIGAEGAYESMRYGTVDEAWAKEHHELWYEEVKSRRDYTGAGGTATAAPAGPVREGWKT
ncbi:MAG: formate dehydrogenase subunit gamma [Rhodospirillaceae bacterium]